MVTALSDLTIFGLDPETTRASLLSAVVVLIALVVRIAGVSLVIRSGVEGENLLRLRASVRNLALAIIALGLFIIWAQELQSVALSLVAIAAATAIATKEVFTCVVGTVYRGSSRPYAIGDRIEFGGLRGDVLDISLLATRVQEIQRTAAGDVVTGRVIVFPNSRLFEAPVFNESADGPFVIDSVELDVPREENWQAERTRLLEAATAATRGFSSDAQAAFDAFTERYGVPSRKAQPRCEIDVARDVIHLQVFFPAPLGRRSEIRQTLWRHFLEDEPGIEAS